MSKRRRHIDSAHETDEDLVPKARESTRKRKRYHSPLTARRIEIKGRKIELMRQYQKEARVRKELDVGWSWLNSLNIPCHNMAIPIKPHTNARNPADSQGSPELDSLSGLNVYDAHSITPEVLSMYCDWRILSGVKARVTGSGEEIADLTVLSRYRSEEKTFQHNDPSKHPSYATAPLHLLSDDDKIKRIERHVFETLCSIKSAFKRAVLRVPEDWKIIPDDDYRSLPPPYEDLLAKAAEYGGRLPEKGEEFFFARESSQPSEGLPGTPPMLEQQARLSLSPRGKEQLDSLLEKFPIGDDVTREDALKNAKSAQEAVYQSTLPNRFDTARRDAAVKLSAKRFEDVVRWISTKGVMEADKLYGLGSVLALDNSSNLAHQTASVILDWLNKRPVEEVDPEEACTEKNVGGLIKDIVVNENLKVRNQSMLPLPDCLRMAAVTACPDVFSQATASTFPSLKYFLPVIFAGECKTKAREGPKTPAQLACALNGTLVLLVLMYLDMRRTAYDPLPPWMFVYGILYTEKGLIIRAHFPTYQFMKDGEDAASDNEFVHSKSTVTAKGGKSKPEAKRKKPSTRSPEIASSSGESERKAVNGDNARWIFKSVEVTTLFSGAFQDKGETQRLRLLAVMLMIQSHSFFLLKQLDAWAQGASDKSAYAAFKGICGG